jgi:hypothetical protein
MLLIVLGSIALFDLSPFNLARHAVLWFVAGQCLLSYVTAGTVKAMHAEWRAGRAITAILSTELFGHLCCMLGGDRVRVRLAVVCVGVTRFLHNLPGVRFAFSCKRGCNSRLEPVCVGVPCHLSRGLYYFM